MRVDRGMAVAQGDGWKHLQGGLCKSHQVQRPKPDAESERTLGHSMQPVFQTSLQGSGHDAGCVALSTGLLTSRHDPGSGFQLHSHEVNQSQRKRSGMIPSPGGAEGSPSQRPQ